MISFSAWSRGPLFGHEGVEYAGVVDDGFAGNGDRVDSGAIVDELGEAAVFEAVATRVGFARGGAGAGALLCVAAVDFGAAGLFLGVGEGRFHRVLLRNVRSENANAPPGEGRAFESDRSTLISR